MMNLSNKITKEHSIFLEYVEDTALDQFVDAMNQPFVTRGALMPDAHTGYTLPIGAVVETDGVVVPAYVGYDIGCGVCAIRTTFRLEDVLGRAEDIYDAVRSVVPMGFSKHKKPILGRSWSIPDHKVMSSIWKDKAGDLQLGTLGGGNHFIEIGYDSGDNIWIIIHSGSRGIGHACASHYMALASPTGKRKEGHHGFDAGSPEGKEYIKALNICELFALENRKAMLKLVVKAMKSIGLHGDMMGNTLINRNHNHAETKNGRYWIHRKGATHAEAGMLGVIPGNMRDGSFIVKGLGNPKSLCSSSHGAGRILSRGRAKLLLTVAKFTSEMKGIQCDATAGNLDESPMAYKDIFKVMDLQKDLTEIVDHVAPVVNIKG